MVVSTHLQNISQNGNLPQIGMNIKFWNHHLVLNNSPSFEYLDFLQICLHELLYIHCLFSAFGHRDPNQKWEWKSWRWITLPKTNIVPQQWWFPIGISFSNGLFSGATMFILGRVLIKIIWPFYCWRENLLMPVTNFEFLRWQTTCINFCWWYSKTLNFTGDPKQNWSFFLLFTGWICLSEKKSPLVWQNQLETP